jgi:signal transduction histidine kinase
MIRWQQGYNLVELMHEWRHLHLCLVDELQLDFDSHPETSREAQASASRIVARMFSDGVCESSDRYNEVRKTEAAGRADYVEAAIGRLNDGARNRADGWREAAHDLRGRLGVVKTAANLLSSSELPQEQREQSLRMLSNSVDWMSAFLNDLMQLSRLEAGHERLQVKQLDVAGILKELCNDLRPIANERRLFLTVEGPAELQVDGDELKILRIAQNLIQNALLYTEAGGVKVTWALDETLDTDRWDLCVQDTGPGLKHAASTPIADALKNATDLEHETVELVGQAPDVAPASTLKSQSDAGPPHATSGEGVGLSIVKRLCELLEATMELQTEAGKGTTFRVTFPLHYDKRAPQAPK